MTALDHPEYARRDVLRMVGITERQLRSWEKLGLLSVSERFGFSELLALKTLKKLRELRIQPRQIQRDRALNEYQRALQTNNNAQGALDEANKYIQHPYSEPPAAAGNSK